MKKYLWITIANFEKIIAVIFLNRPFHAGFHYLDNGFYYGTTKEFNTWKLNKENVWLKFELIKKPKTFKPRNIEKFIKQQREALINFYNKK